MRSLLKIACLYGFIAFGIHSGDTASTKIVNGHSIEIESRPFVVSLHSNKIGFQCGGSIIHRHWVLTAEHCIPRGNNSHDYFVRAGSTYENTGGSKHSISKAVYYHNPKMLAKNDPKHDILLLRVKDKFKLSEKIKLINLPDANSKAPHKLWVSGWGGTQKMDWLKHGIKLQTVELDYLTYKKCLEKEPTHYPTVVSNKYHLCYYRHNRDACEGDSGGPLADRRTIYGIVSFGAGCAKFPGIYVKVAYYVHWINKVLKSNSKDN